jgi:hypothetical protein
VGGRLRKQIDYCRARSDRADAEHCRNVQTLIEKGAIR